MGEARFTFGDVSLLVPAGWKDRSLLSFHEAGPGAKAAGYTHSVTVARDEIAREAPLGAYVDRQVAQLAGTLPEFQLLARAPVLRRDGREAVRLDVAWREFEGRRLRQIMMIVRAETRVILLTGTALESTWAEYRELLERLAGSVRID